MQIPNLIASACLPSQLGQTAVIELILCMLAQILCTGYNSAGGGSRRLECLSSCFGRTRASEMRTSITFRLLLLTNLLVLATVAAVALLAGRVSGTVVEDRLVHDMA